MTIGFDTKPLANLSIKGCLHPNGADNSASLPQFVKKFTIDNISMGFDK